MNFRNDNWELIDALYHWVWLHACGETCDLSVEPLSLITRMWWDMWSLRWTTESDYMHVMRHVISPLNQWVWLHACGETCDLSVEPLSLITCMWRDMWSLRWTTEWVWLHACGETCDLSVEPLSLITCMWRDMWYLRWTTESDYTHVVRHVISPLNHWVWLHACDETCDLSVEPLSLITCMWWDMWSLRWTTESDYMHVVRHVISPLNHWVWLHACGEKCDLSVQPLSLIICMWWDMWSLRWTPSVITCMWWDMWSLRWTTESDYMHVVRHVISPLNHWIWLHACGETCDLSVEPLSVITCMWWDMWSLRWTTQSDYTHVVRHVISPLNHWVWLHACGETCDLSVEPLSLIARMWWDMWSLRWTTESDYMHVVRHVISPLNHWVWLHACGETCDLSVEPLSRITCMWWDMWSLRWTTESDYMHVVRHVISPLNHSILQFYSSLRFRRIKYNTMHTYDQHIVPVIEK